MGIHDVTVLLAVAGEDEPEALARLRAAGHRVETAGPRGALDLLGSGPVDVLVASARTCADLHGVVAEALRRDPLLEVVVAAAPLEFDEALACLRAGASDVVARPIDAEALLSAVTRALERRAARGLARELLQLSRSTGLGQLAGGIAHEIANPVAVLTSSLGALAGSVEALAELRPLAAQPEGLLRAWWERSGRQALEQAEEVVAEVRESAERLRLLARDLRAMAGCDPAALSELEVADAVEAALRVGRADLTPRVNVTVEVARRLLVRASRGALSQALVHVLVRASQAAHDAGVPRANVRVRAREHGATVVIEVEDDVAHCAGKPSAVGPAAEAGAARFLAPYLPAGAPAGPGALGLAVARDLLERQGGALVARSTATGTLFELELRAVTATRPGGHRS